MARAGLLAALVWAAVEAGAALAGPARTGAALVYEGPAVPDFARYAARRDPMLGWTRPSPGWGEESLDASGARYLPAFPDPSLPPCVSLYGDSFTFGSEVDDEHTWANVLARRLGCRVASYGVPGYGADQAYLRFVSQERDRPRAALLVVYADHVQRDVNRFRPLLAPGTSGGLKPRFRLDEGGGLVLVPVLLPDEAELRAIGADPTAHLPDEWFLPDTPDGPVRWSFPFTAALVRLVASHRLHARLTGEPVEAPFYDPAHPSRALAITAAIAAAFRAEAERRGAFAGVVLLPSCAGLRARRARGAPVHGPLLDALARAGLPHVDASARLLEVLPSGEECSLYTRGGEGHFTVAGYRLVGGLVGAWLERAAPKLP
jgi:hypothetical protein